MISKAPNIEELRRTILNYLKNLRKDEYAKKCLHQLKIQGPIFKDIQLSERAKLQANKLYGQKDLNFVQLYNILRLYNLSIAMAPKDSKELATAYANKSAVLLRMRKYKECILESDKALKITELMALRIKMLCRKTECLTAMGSSENRSVLEKAKFILAKIEDSEKEKPSLNKLIEKTQSVIDKRDLDIPRENKRRMQALNMIEEADRKDLSESIRFQYSKKYGVHLVAARDFEPGDIIFVEKPYLNRLDDSKAHQYCDYCFNHLWTAVPCDHCSRRLYCSEECRIKEWNEYHEIECFVLTNMVASLGSQWNKHLSFLLSFFFKALKEAGSIEQMVADCKASEQCNDQNSIRVSLNTNSTSYKDVFTLPISVDKKEFEASVKDSITILTGLAKYTKVLGKSYDFTEMQKLMKDDTAIVVGTLLLKFTILLVNGRPVVYLADPNDERIIPDEKKNQKPAKKPNEKRMTSQFNHCLPSLMLHTVTGCIPNVKSIYTYDNNYLLCAIIPIKEGDELIPLAKSKSVWIRSTKSDRQFDYINTYDFPCECRACTDWSGVLDSEEECAKLLFAEMHCLSTWKLWEQRNSIIADWEANCHKPNFPDIKVLLRAIDVVSTACKRLRMPSALMIKAVWLLASTLSAFYDRSEVYSKVPHLRPENVGEILDHSAFCSCENE